MATNWSSEPVKQLDLDDETVIESIISHGDYIVLTECHLPPKGYLKCTVRLFPTFENQIIPPDAMELHSNIKNLFLNFEESTRKIDSSYGIHIGEVEISNEDTIGQLKKYIVSLPALSNLNLPSAQHLRMRLLDKGRVAKVLRGLSNPLKKLKLQSYNSLAVQLLLKEEDLKENEILIHIYKRQIKTRSYSPLSEAVWNVAKSASPNSLTKFIANSLACPAEKIMIAKKFPEKFKWIIIGDGAISKKK